MKHCIACAESIKLEARLCKYCKTVQDDARFLNRVLDDRVQPSPSVQTDNSTHAVANLESEIQESDEKSPELETRPIESNQPRSLVSKLLIAITLFLVAAIVLNIGSPDF